MMQGSQSFHIIGGSLGTGPPEHHRSYEIHFQAAPVAWKSLYVVQQVFLTESARQAAAGREVST